MELTLEVLLRGTGGTLLADPTGGTGAKFDGVSVDSRTITSGQIFFALVGDNLDGHDFLEAAVDGGAGALVVCDSEAQRITGGIQGTTAILSVPDTHAALLSLATEASRLLPATKIAITGSTGKTTVKDMLLSILQVSHSAVASLKSFNNEIGVPLTVLNAPSSCDYLILEIGMRSPGDVALLAQVISPSVGIITNVGPSHIGRLGSLEAIAGAKSELIDYVPESGAVVLNHDDPFSAAMADRAKAAVIWFGGSDSPGVAAFAAGESMVDARDPLTEIDITYGGRSVRAALSLLGSHQTMNAAAAAAGAVACGVSLDDISAGLSRAGLSPMRMEVGESSCGAVIINDAYNANPDSMASALKTLAGLSAQRRIAILGAMKELGDYSRDAHREIGRLAASLPIDLLVTIGAEAEEIADAAIEGDLAGGTSPGEQVYSCGDVDTARLLVEEMLEDGRIGNGDMVLVKASRAVGLEAIVEVLENFHLQGIRA